MLDPHEPSDPDFLSAYQAEIRSFFRVFYAVLACICILGALAGFFYLCLCAWSALPG